MCDLVTVKKVDLRSTFFFIDLAVLMRRKSSLSLYKRTKPNQLSLSTPIKSPPKKKLRVKSPLPVYQLKKQRIASPCLYAKKALFSPRQAKQNRKCVFETDWVDIDEATDPTIDENLEVFKHFQQILKKVDLWDDFFSFMTLVVAYNETNKYKKIATTHLR